MPQPKSTNLLRLPCAPIKKSLRFASRLAFMSPLLLAALKPDASLAQRPLGIDVSSYQGSGINWSQVKGGGYVFAWTKATEGEYDVDADFAINENNGKAAGVYMGAYDFCRPDLYAPTSEASYFWSAAGSYIQGDGLTLNPMLDFETFNGFTSATSYSDWANQWCNWVVNEGTVYGVNVKPFLYTSACSASHFDSSVSGWFPDIADYGPGANGSNNPQTGTPWAQCSADDVWGGWTVWQYESINNSGVPGYNGNGSGQPYTSIDCDVYNGSLSGLTNQVLVTSSATGGVFSYWDPQGNNSQNPYQGSMSETWEDAKWSTSSSGQATPINWVENKCCVIGVHTTYPTTPAFTITVTNNHFFAGLFMGGLSGQGPANVTLNGPGTISLSAGPQGLWVSSPGSLNFGVSIAGDGVAVPQSAGSLYFNASNSFSGGTSIGYYANTAFTGPLYFNNNYAFGTGPIAFSNCFGCALQVEGSSAINITNSVIVPVASSVNFVANTAGLTFSGPWALNNSIYFSTGGAANNLVTISGPISGSGALLKTNVGILVLSGTNSYSGNTSIANGTLNITATGKLGNGSYSHSITNNGTFIYSSTASQTFSGVISGTGSLTVSNGGVLTLSGANTYSGGTTVSFGSALDISTDGALGASTAAITLNGGTLKNNSSQPVVASTRTITLGANGGFLDAGWAPTNALTINAAIGGSGALCINMDGSPVVLGSTGNVYSGNTIIGTNGPAWFSSGSSAWLKLGASGVIPNGSGKGNVFIYSAYNGWLDLNGFNQTINGFFGDGTVTNSGAAATLTVGNNNVSSAFNGVIGIGANTIGLAKIGSGTLTLNGTNTYTGGTGISAGTLALGANGSISNTATVSISAGATLDVSAFPSYVFPSSAIVTGGGNASAASVKGSSGGTVSIGSQRVTLPYDGSHPALTISQGALVLNGTSFFMTGAALPVGTYTIVSQSSGSISTSGTLTVSGPQVSGKTASIVVSNGNVNLVVQETPTFSNLTASPTINYGATSVTLSGKVSASGPLYPTSGETVTVTINGNAQNTTTSDLTGDFSINYNAATIPFSSNAYTITYAYGGDASLTAASDTSKTLTVNPRVAVLTGKRAYNGTAVAAAAILSVSNKVGSDAVTVASGSGTLASTNVGTQPITSLGNLALGGAAAGNYTLTGASGSVVITAPSFSISSTALDLTGSNIVITWQSAPGATYQVLGSPDLLTWTNVGAPIVAISTVTSATNAVNSAANFFSVTGH